MRGEFVAIIVQFFRPSLTEKMAGRTVRVVYPSHPPIKGVRQNLIMTGVAGGWRFNP